MTQRLSFSTLISAIPAIFLVVFTSSVFAQTASKSAAPTSVSSQPSTTTATYGDWTLRCVSPAAQPAGNGQADSAAPRTCEIVLTVQVQGQSQPIAQLAIGHLPNQTDLIMTAVLPVNISLPGKVHISGNAKTGAEEQGGLDMTWRRCVPGACFAEAKPGKDVLAVMRKEMAGQLRFEDASGRMIALPLSWHGFAQALRALG